MACEREQWQVYLKGRAQLLSHRVQLPVPVCVGHAHGHAHMQAHMQTCVRTSVWARFRRVPYTAGSVAVALGPAGPCGKKLWGFGRGTPSGSCIGNPNPDKHNGP